MKKRLKILVGIGAVLIFFVFIYWGNQTNHKLLSAISFEPTYEGETLSYWMAHWYQQYGQRNMEAEEAVRSMGTNALPYLVKWIGVSARSSSDYDYCGRALKGFEVLGPTATPAIPDLIKIIGRNGNFPACALGYIGTNAIPALTEKLLESVAFTNEPAKSSFHFSDFFAGSRWPREEYYVQMNIFCTLSFYGTNAQAAVPALILYLQNSNAKEPGSAVGILAMAGHNQPNIVIPVLIKTFSTSSGYVRASAADALASFGTNALSAIPVLISDSQDADANARAHIAVAIKQIAPQTPNALDPLIQNLEHREASQQSLYILESLGTNGVDALPVLLKCLRDPNAQVRTDTARCLQKIDCYSDEIIVALGENISHANEYVAQEAEAALGQFASRSKLAFVTLIKKAICGGIGGQDLQQSKYYLINISRDNPKFMLECLDDTDAGVRLGALIVFDDLARGVPEAVPKLRQLATNDPDASVRSRAADVLQLQLQ